MSVYYLMRLQFYQPSNSTFMKYINKEDVTRKHDVTVEEVKAIPMFAHFTDVQAKEVIQTIKTFVKIALEYYKTQQKNNDNTTDF